jgi:hypothetical protein
MVFDFRFLTAAIQRQQELAELADRAKWLGQLLTSSSSSNWPS